MSPLYHAQLLNSFKWYFFKEKFILSCSYLHRTNKWCSPSSRPAIGPNSIVLSPLFESYLTGIWLCYLFFSWCMCISLRINTIVKKANSASNEFSWLGGREGSEHSDEDFDETIRIFATQGAFFCRFISYDRVSIVNMDFKRGRLWIWDRDKASDFLSIFSAPVM